jgi:Zn-dependent M28 family amino/carboxypeptidase
VLTVSGERPPGWSKWGAVQNNVADRLKATGFEVEEQVFDGLADTAGAVHKGVNVIGRKKGRSKSEEVVILSAHYDHIPGCDGADDNASGVAVVLEAAKVLGQRSFDRTLILAFWDWEEWGLLGSTAYAQRERAKRTDIKLAISLDGVGFADHRPGSQQVPSGLDIVAPEIVKELEESGSLGDFIAVIGDTDAEPFVSAYRKHGAARGLPVVGSGLSAMSRLVLLDTARSDHASFWLAGFPAMLVTDTANFRNPRYHCYDGADTPDTLDYTFLARVASTTIDVVAESL